MKKKLFLGLIPAILALSACAGAAPEDKANEANVFLEDTLLHEELFEQSDPTFVNKEIKKLPYVDETGPKIGVQNAIYGDEDGLMAIRFVAAINLEGKVLSDVEIVWDRAVYTNGGSVYNNIIGEKQVEKVYTTIYDGNDTISAPTGYTHFVTYTVRNIPVANQNYVVTASLSIDGVSNNKVCASSIDLTRQASFEKGTTGYFLAGTFDGSQRVIRQSGAYKGDGDVTTFIASLKQGDKFLLVNNDSTTSHFEIFSNTINANNTLFSITDNKIVAKNNGDVFLIYSDDAHLYSGNIKFFLAGGMNGYTEDYDVAVAGNYALYYDNDSESAVLTRHMNQGDEFAVRVYIDGKSGKWIQNKNTWSNSNFHISSGNNDKIDVTGDYTLHFYPKDTRNPFGLEADGVSPRIDVSLVGTATEGKPRTDNYHFVPSYVDGYLFELRNVELDGGSFKVQSADETTRFQWDDVYLNDTSVHGFGNTPKGTAVDNKVIDYQDNTWVIGVKKPGTVDLFITDNYKLIVNEVA